MSTLKTNRVATNGHHLVLEGPLTIAFPDPELSLSQDEEWCLLRRDRDKDWQKIRFHDYTRIYEVEGLYERLFRDALECRSPEKIADLLGEQVQKSERPIDSLRVLDLGAGNGMVGEALKKKGVRHLVGVDILQAARDAVMRDRPGVYSRFLVADMTDLAADTRAELQEERLNCLTCVAALGFGDIPVQVFIEAYNLIEPGGLVAFNIKEEFLSNGSGSEFCDLVRSMFDRGDMEVLASNRYIHRKATCGLPLHYVAFVGRKQRSLTAAPSSSSSSSSSSLRHPSTGQPVIRTPSR